MVALCDQCETVTLCSRRGECLPVVGEKQNQGKSLGQIFHEAAYPQKTKIALWDFAPSGGQLICERGAQAVAAHVRAEPLMVKPINIEFITAAKKLLTIATSAAYKIKVEQNRGAGYMHSEVDWLVQCNPAIRAWLVKTGWGGQIYEAPSVQQIDALDFSPTLLKGQPL